MSETNPTRHQKHNEAVIAMEVAIRVFVRALLVLIAELAGRPQPEVSQELHKAIDGLFVNYRNVTYESLKLHESLITEQQRTAGNLEDRIEALEMMVFGQRARTAGEEPTWRHE